MELGKLQPQAVEIEEAVLGAALMYEDTILMLSTMLVPEDFYKAANATIWKAMLTLFDKSEPIDLLTLTSKLRDNGELDIVGGAFHISQLTNKASVVGITAHAKIIKEKSIARQQILFSSEVIKKAYDETTDVFETSDYILTEAYKISDVNTGGTAQTNSELLDEVSERLKNAKELGGITGITTGITKKDELFKGYQPSDLIIKAGRPGMGKTADALCEAYHMAFIEKQEVMFFSLEMSAIQLMNRLVLIATELDSDKLKTGELQEHEWELYHNKTQILKSSKLTIIDNVHTFNGIRKVVKLKALKKPPKAIFIDYLQLCTNNVKGGNREQEISQMSRGFKLLAKELNIPIILLSQLSRAVEQRGGDKKPILSDLRESGAIEQDADIVQFLYRPEYYGIMEDEHGQPTTGIGYCIIAKHRNGSLEDIPMRFVANSIKFKNIEGTEPQAKPMEPNPTFEDEAPF